MCFSVFSYIKASLRLRKPLLTVINSLLKALLHSLQLSFRLLNLLLNLIKLFSLMFRIVINISDLGVPGVTWGGLGDLWRLGGEDLVDLG